MLIFFIARCTFYDVPVHVWNWYLFGSNILIYNAILVSMTSISQDFFLRQRRQKFKPKYFLDPAMNRMETARRPRQYLYWWPIIWLHISDHGNKFMEIPTWWKGRGSRIRQSIPSADVKQASTRGFVHNRQSRHRTCHKMLQWKVKTKLNYNQIFFTQIRNNVRYLLFIIDML